MQELTESTLKSLFASKTRNSRNIAIVGTKDSGVSSLKNFLFRNYGIKPNEGFKMEDIDSGNIQLIFEEANLITVSDASSLCDKDGLLIVVDVTKKQLDSAYLLPILKDALCLKLKLIWFFNKLDRQIFEPSVPTSEELYQLLVEKIDQLNALLEQVADQSTEGGEEVNPLKSNVLFGSAVDGWAFSIEHFAKEYAQMVNTEPSKMISKLWGENFYNHFTKTWYTEVKSTSNSLRSFCSFILDPICKIYHAIREGDSVEKIINGLNIKGDFKKMSGRLLLRNVMYAWMNSAKITARTIMQCIPSYQEGLQDHGRHTVFSNFLSEKTQDNSSILSIFGQDQDGNKLVKVLKKNTSKAVETWNVFKSDLFDGQTLIGKENITQFNCRVFSKVNMTISWEDIQQGDVVMIQSSSSQIGNILTDLPTLPFFKTYLPALPSNKSSINSEKTPFSVQNYLLGTFSVISKSLGDLLIRKNELFESKKELQDHLLARYEFTPQDAESIVNVQNGCVVINYADNSISELLSSAFSKAILSAKLFFVRIEVETIISSSKLTEEELAGSLVQELSQYLLSKE